MRAGGCGVELHAGRSWVPQSIFHTIQIPRVCIAWTPRMKTEATARGCSFDSKAVRAAVSTRYAAHRASLAPRDPGRQRGSGNYRFGWMDYMVQTNPTKSIHDAVGVGVWMFTEDIKDKLAEDRGAVKARRGGVARANRGFFSFRPRNAACLSATSALATTRPRRPSTALALASTLL